MYKTYRTYMILGIDLRCLPADGSEGAGIAHAARAITRALCMSMPAGWNVRLYLSHGSRINIDTNAHAEIILLSGSRRHDLMEGLKRSPCDFLFVPSGAVALHLPVPAIPWVHDVDIYAHPEWFGESWLTRMRTTWMFRQGLKRAPIIFAVSEYTGREIRKQKIENRIEITGEGGDETLRSATKEERIKAKERLKILGIADRFILMLGTVEPRKNIPFSLSVLRTVAHQPRIPLVIAGKDGWKTDRITHDINSASSVLDIIRLKEISEEFRRDLLISSSLILVPSFSEGFGLVALEGIQAGIPVLASNRGALPEIVGETALPLEDPKAWELAIHRLLMDDGYRREWIEKQNQGASRYSWAYAAEVIWKGLHT